MAAHGAAFDQLRQGIAMVLGDGPYAEEHERGAAMDSLDALDLGPRNDRAALGPPVRILDRRAAQRSRHLSSVGQSDALVMRRSSVRFRQAAQRAYAGKSDCCDQHDGGRGPDEENDRSAPLIDRTEAAAATVAAISPAARIRP